MYAAPSAGRPSPPVKRSESVELSKFLSKGRSHEQEPDARKFTIGPDGKFVDNGIAVANKLNSSAVLVPVKVVGTLDGQWQPIAWKTDAFYGNPLQGFTAP